MDVWLDALLNWLALPRFGLTALFVVALVSATLLPLGSEPVLFGLIKLNPDLLWPAVVVATAGNTLGGVVTWWTGYGAESAYERVTKRALEHRLLGWLQRFGPRSCLLAWLPVVGDPLVALAGWLKLPFWPCLVYMAIGKFLRYLTLTAGLMWVFPGQLSH